MSETGFISPLESSKFVMSNSKHVKICSQAIHDFVKIIKNQLSDGNCKYFDYKQQKLHPHVANEDSINWLFMVNTMNFSFWGSSETRQGRYEIEYNGEYYYGYMGLVAAINRAIDEGYPITDSKFYSNISEIDLKNILRSDSPVEIPLFEERLRVLRETGKILQEKFSGSFVNCVKLANKSAIELLKIIVNNFPAYRDEATYMGKKVTFYKRAQVVISGIWSCFEGRDLGEFTDIDELTIFADYRIPQLLRYSNVIEYSAELDDLIKSNKILKNGEEREVEIRAACVCACNLIIEGVVDLLKQDSKLANIKLNAVLIDRYLWCYRRDNAEKIELFMPCHKVRSIYY